MKKMGYSVYKTGKLSSFINTIWLENLQKPMRSLPGHRRRDVGVLEVVLLMAEIWRENQLRLVVYPIIYRVSYIPGGVGFQPSTV